MMDDCNVVLKNIGSTFVDSSGNLNTNYDSNGFFLEDNEGNIVSHQYFCMDSLGWDHYSVCDVIPKITTYGNYYEDAIMRDDYEIAVSLKWGIIRVNRNERGKIIPMGETLIMPYIYDKISSNNSKTATVKSNGFLTYVDIDVESANYGNQLVPCVLNHAVPFDVQYEGFAECSVGDIIGYLPRKCRARDYINGEELLNEIQVSFLEKYLNSSSDIFISPATMSAYFKLTGIRLQQDNGTVLTKKKQYKNK